MTMSICPRCHTGRLQQRAMVYVQWFDDDQLVVDRLPGVVCDVCGESAYDDEAVEQLERLLWDGETQPVSSYAYHLV
jgi:YgiT-type zinc finger domain-containing protein